MEGILKLKETIVRSIDESIAAKGALKTQADQIAEAAQIIIECFRRNGKLILFGNGGSAADAQHIAAEFIGIYGQAGKSLPAIALTVNTSCLTAIANDQGYEHVFERQVEALCNVNDVVIAISTSGNSQNVLAGVEAARKKRAKLLGLTGRHGGKLAPIVDLAIRVPSDSTTTIQECHILVGHTLFELAKRELATEKMAEAA